jgi:hypothetical protein
MDKIPNIVPAGPLSLPRQINMTFDPVELRAMSAAQRSNAIGHLASLLTQAAGVPLAKERDDEER